MEKKTTFVRRRKKRAALLNYTKSITSLTAIDKRGGRVVVPLAPSSTEGPHHVHPFNSACSSR